MMEQNISTPFIEKIKIHRQANQESSRDPASSIENQAGFKWGSLRLLDSVVLPGLLVLQFNQAADIEELGFWMLNFSIALFTFTAFLFRKTVVDFQINSLLVASLPEWVALAATSLVFSQNTLAGFLTMIFGMLTMSLVIVWQTARMLAMTKEQSVKSSSKTASPTEVTILVV